MRTFPKELATFRRIINERCDTLRGLSHDELIAAGQRPTESLKVALRSAVIKTIIQVMPDESVRIVVQGFMYNRFLPGKSVALDGFYKMPNGLIKPIPDKEFYEFD